MNGFLYNLLPLFLSLILSEIIYIRIDKKYNISSKISLRLHVQQEWLAAVSFLSTFVVIIIIGVLGIFVIKISSTIYCIVGGIMDGVTIAILERNREKSSFKK